MRKKRIIKKLNKKKSLPKLSSSDILFINRPSLQGLSKEEIIKAFFKCKRLYRKSQNEIERLKGILINNPYARIKEIERMLFGKTVPPEIQEALTRIQLKYAKLVEMITNLELQIKKIFIK